LFRGFEASLTLNGTMAMVRRNAPVSSSTAIIPIDPPLTIEAVVVPAAPDTIVAVPSKEQVPPARTY